MHEILQHRADFVATTADIWTCVATDSNLTVTAHYLNEEWEMTSMVSVYYLYQKVT